MDQTKCLDVGSSVVPCQGANVENLPFWYSSVNGTGSLVNICNSCHFSDTKMSVPDRVKGFERSSS